MTVTMTREEIADGIMLYISSDDANGTILARETRHCVDRLYWCEEGEVPWMGSSRWDPLISKSSEGIIAGIGRMNLYIQNGKFNRELYVNLDQHAKQKVNK